MISKRDVFGLGGVVLMVAGWTLTIVHAIEPFTYPFRTGLWALSLLLSALWCFIEYKNGGWSDGERTVR